MIKIKDGYVNEDLVEYATITGSYLVANMMNGEKVSSNDATLAIEKLLSLPHFIYQNTVFFIKHVSSMKCSDTMATVRMTSGYLATIRGQELIDEMKDAFTKPEGKKKK